MSGEALELRDGRRAIHTDAWGLSPVGTGQVPGFLQRLQHRPEHLLFFLECGCDQGRRSTSHSGSSGGEREAPSLVEWVVLNVQAEIARVLGQDFPDSSPWLPGQVTYRRGTVDATFGTAKCVYR